MAPVSPSRPNPLIFAGLLAAAIVFGWIDFTFALAMTGGEKDFGTFYDAARALAEGRDMYVSGTNLNPPHFYVLLLPLAGLTRRAAWVLWGAANVSCLAWCVRLIVREVRPQLTAWGASAAFVAIVCSPATSAVIITGQLAWVLMLPVTYVWVAARHNRWVRAGAILGAVISVKPFLAIMLPYLLIQRRWQAALAAAGGAAACVGLGVAVVGLRAYAAWASVLAHVSWAFLPMNASATGLLTRVLSSAARPYFEPVADLSGLISPLGAIVAAAIAAISLVVTSRERGPADLDRNFALLLVAAMLISPLGWIYYIWLAAGPLVAAVLSFWSKDGRARRLFVLSQCGLFCPVPLITLLKTHAWATPTLGSLYFWATLTLWASLLVSTRARPVGAEARPAGWAWRAT